jgi:GNAT superfamily N-acetyltransferase
MGVVIKTSKDHRLLASLNEQVQEWHHQNYPDVFKPFEIKGIEDAFQLLLDKEGVFAFIAMQNGKAIGYLLVFLESRSESAFQYAKKIMIIDQILVLEAYRNLGVGQALMKRAMLLAKEHKVDEIQLDHLAANQAAEKFFAKHGFVNFKHKLKK